MQDIHITHADHIAAAEWARAQAGPLRIVYGGRANPMKRPFDWLGTLEGLAARRGDFRAEWLGDGSDLPAMRARVAAGELDGGLVLLGLQAAHAILFCRKTPELPRVLIEALASGTPFVGYDSIFPRPLVSGHGGGSLTPMNDVAALTEAVAGLAAERGHLADLIVRAATDGAQFEDVKVFAHRSEVLRKHLDPFVRPQAG